MTVPGDRCYIEYKNLMNRWKESPRWTTIDQMLQGFEPDPFKRAFFLAFLVFFVTHGMDYEAEKKRTNGDIY